MPRRPSHTPCHPSAANDAKCTPTKRAKAIILHEDMEMPFTQICQRSPFKKISPLTLSRNYNTVKSHGGDCYYDGRQGKSGQKRALSDEQLMEAEERFELGELIDGEDVRRVMFPGVPGRTVRDNLSAFGLEGFAQRKKANLLPRHVAQRQSMYERYKDWTSEENFLRGVLINSDESKIVLGVSDGRRYVRRRRGRDTFAPRSIQPTEAHGRKKIKVNVWGAIHPKGVSKLIRIDGMLDAELYIKILEHAMIPIYDHFENRPHSFLFFQQDNDPKHTSRLAKKWFQDHDIQVFEWPAKSPDLSPIENAWSELKRRVKRHERYMEIASAEEFFEVLSEIWESVSFQQ
ncbi:DDE-3 domain-containing protein [Mycena venus]|uniref:DDE-3 domain-containing protein n=1 Tax=Mycena venus TaxID=2733690 RepID=A0A8H6U461_9AGAR|nr:DDE-3 domain-containing protein [Mycena venus]